MGANIVSTKYARTAFILLLTLWLMLFRLAEFYKDRPLKVSFSTSLLKVTIVGLLGRMVVDQDRDFNAKSLIICELEGSRCVLDVQRIQVSPTPPRPPRFPSVRGSTIIVRPLPVRLGAELEKDDGYGDDDPRFRRATDGWRFRQRLRWRCCWPLPVKQRSKNARTIPSTAEPAQSTTSKDAQEIVSQPAKDVGIEKTKIPPLLVEVSKNPYGTRGTATCGQISAAIADLNQVLGPDFSASPPTAKKAQCRQGRGAGCRELADSVPRPGPRGERRGTGRTPAQRGDRRGLRSARIPPRATACAGLPHGQVADSAHRTGSRAPAWPKRRSVRQQQRQVGVAERVARGAAP